MPDVKDRCAANIAAFRRDAKLTQEELAARLKLSQQAVSSWERGETSPSLENLEALAGALNKRVCEFLAEAA